MFVLMGSNGNITSKAARMLLAQGKPVRVIGRNAQALAAVKQSGAELAIGDAGNADFLATAFTGATAVFTMIPPNYGAVNMRKNQNDVGEAIARAIAKSGVKRVVNLSSVGAHLPNGTGPIAGLHDQEQRLNKLPGLELLHVRAAYFFENHLHAAGLIAAFGVYPSMDRSTVAYPMIATEDIATVVVRELVTPGRRGVLHIEAPRRYTMQEAATILGTVIGKAELTHVQADPAQAKGGMTQHGFSPDAADQFQYMANALSDGSIIAGVDAGPTEKTRTTLEQFAPLFASAFQGIAKAA